MLRAITLTVVFCVVKEINCLNTDNGNSDGWRNVGYTRVKRAKHYNSPYKIYKSSYGPSFRGPFSHPPPGYTGNDIGQPFSENVRPYKVSKRPADIGLEDEDIQNLVKYLSKKDLDKVIELTLDKERLSDKYRDYGPSGLNNNDNYIFHVSNSRGPYENNKFLTDSYPNSFEKNTLLNVEYGNPNINYPNNYQSAQPTKNIYPQALFEAEESRNNDQLSLLDAYIQKEISEMNPDKHNIFSDSKTVEEEHLPKPANLREYDYDTSFTNKVQSVAKPDSSSYKLENFADLPLMEYHNSKLETVNSYSVPHYSVIPSINKQASQSQSSFLSSSHSPSSSISSLINAPDVEVAPPASAAKEQSDAHLKAIKIWTHKSKGTAYTLHDDGTLSPEKSSRPRHKFA